MYPMRATVLGLVVGSSDNTIALEMDLLCVFLLWQVMDCGLVGQGAWPSRRSLARLSAEATHNHQGIKGASMATSDAIFMCHITLLTVGIMSNQSVTLQECKRLIKEHIEEEYGYNLSQSLDEIRLRIVSMKRVRIQFLRQSLHFWKVETSKMPNAISLGGDDDALLLQ